MDSLSAGLLILLGLVAFNNYKNRTLPDWLRAKFFGQAPGEAPGPAPTSGAGQITPAAYTGLGAGRGPLLAPVSGPVSSPFGSRSSGFHAGLDFAVPVGTPVRAARAGRVTAAGAAGDYGLRVDVDHGDGVTTRYAHLSRIDVRVGQTVAAGATLGLSGNTGHSTGPHVHFEVRINGLAKNPADYLTGAGLPQAVSA